MPLEMLDLPLPGGPYIRIDRPEVTAGPRLSIRSGGRIRCPMNLISSVRVIFMLRTDWRFIFSL